MHKLLFDIHRWLGVILIVYVVAICVTGSVLVYRNELYRTFSPQPVYVPVGNTVLTDNQIGEIAQRAFPDHAVTVVERTDPKPNRAVDVELEKDDNVLTHLFDPYTGPRSGRRTAVWLSRHHLHSEPAHRAALPRRGACAQRHLRRSSPDLGRDRPACLAAAPAHAKAEGIG
ncbi:MAG: PepSY domain-containing protein [Hyphomonadaceae bacterium]|nr:PepSY domain-containing protein [Hyphomonadaceae bacterium]